MSQVLLCNRSGSNENTTDDEDVHPIPTIYRWVPLRSKQSVGGSPRGGSEGGGGSSGSGSTGLQMRLWRHHACFPLVSAAPPIDSLRKWLDKAIAPHSLLQFYIFHDWVSPRHAIRNWSSGPRPRHFRIFVLSPFLSSLSTPPLGRSKKGLTKVPTDTARCSPSFSALAHLFRITKLLVIYSYRNTEMSFPGMDPAKVHDHDVIGILIHIIQRGSLNYNQYNQLFFPVPGGGGLLFNRIHSNIFYIHIIIFYIMHHSDYIFTACSPHINECPPRVD